MTVDKEAIFGGKGMFSRAAKGVEEAAALGKATTVPNRTFSTERIVEEGLAAKANKPMVRDAAALKEQGLLQIVENPAPAYIQSEMKQLPQMQLAAERSAGKGLVRGKNKRPQMAIDRSTLAEAVLQGGSGGPVTPEMASALFQGKGSLNLPAAKSTIHAPTGITPNMAFKGAEYSPIIMMEKEAFLGSVINAAKGVGNFARGVQAAGRKAAIQTHKGMRGSGAAFGPKATKEMTQKAMSSAARKAQGKYVLDAGKGFAKDQAKGIAAGATLGLGAAGAASVLGADKRASWKVNMNHKTAGFEAAMAAYGVTKVANLKGLGAKAMEAASGAKAKGTEALNALKGHGAELKAQGAEALDAAKQHGEGMMGEAKARGADAMDALKWQGEHAMQDMKARGADALESLKEVDPAHAAAAAGLGALGIGAGMGLKKVLSRGAKAAPEVVSEVAEVATSPAAAEGAAGLMDKLKGLAGSPAAVPAAAGLGAAGLGAGGAALAGGDTTDILGSALGAGAAGTGIAMSPQILEALKSQMASRNIGNIAADALG